MKRLLVLALLVVPLLAVLETNAPGLASTGDGGWFFQDTTALVFWDVCFIDVDCGWAVGREGAFSTDDGGATWRARNIGSSQALFGVSFKGDSGWIVGRGGAIFHTGDGGLSWSPQASGSTEELYSVASFGAGRAWAVGWNGVILGTVDGGDTWNPQTSGTTEPLEGVAFADARNGWAVGRMSTMLHTNDGGATWTPQYPGLVTSWTNVTCVDADHVWAVTGNGRVVYSSDAGAIWDSSPLLPGNPLYGVCFIDAEHGWVCGNMGAIFMTDDGGLTWTRQASGVDEPLFGVSFVDAMHGWCAGETSQILHTVTGGAPDSTAPMTSQEGADDLWHNTDRTVTFSASDPDAPYSFGVAFTEYRVDGGDWTQSTNLTVEANNDHSNDGSHIIHYRSADGGGNLEVTRSCQVKIDTTCPVTTPLGTDNAWHAPPVTVLLGALDSLSGVARTEFSLDGGAWTTGTMLTVSTDGTRALDYRSTDNAGNVEAVNSCQVKTDGVAPVTVQAGADDAWHQSPVTVSFAASDATSGVEKTEYRLDAGSWTTGTQVTVFTDGDHTLRYRSQDRAGNIEEAKTCRVRIDRTPPVTTQAGADGRWHNLAVTVAFTASDRASGVASTSYSVDGGVTWETGSCIVQAPATHDNDGTHTILYRSTDNAGLVEVPRSCTVKIDTRQPVTAAPSSATVRRGYRATLGYRVDDQQPCASRANVTIKVATLGGRVVKVLKLGQRSVNRLLSYQFRCTLAKRTYKFRVLATDAAGNKQAVAGWNRLIVR